jgi:integrase
MELLGHSSFNLTMNTYGHVLEEMKRETARQTDAVFNSVTIKPPASLTTGEIA